MIWSAWWAWMLIAVVLGFVELLAPAVVALGFALGALALGILFLVGGPAAAWLSGSLPLTLLAFAALSLVAWIVLRQVFGLRGRSGKIWHDDIND